MYGPVVTELTVPTEIHNTHLFGPTLHSWQSAHFIIIITAIIFMVSKCHPIRIAGGRGSIAAARDRCRPYHLNIIIGVEQICGGLSVIGND